MTLTPFPIFAPMSSGYHRIRRYRSFFHILSFIHLLNGDKEGLKGDGKASKGDALKSNGETLKFSKRH